MGQTFKIQPGDQSLVGKKIRTKSWKRIVFIHVKFVGDVLIVGIDQNGKEILYNFEGEEFELYEEPKKKVLMAPAIVKTPYGYAMSEYFYSSEKEAKDDIEIKTISKFICWPAIPNKDGFYEVPE